MTNTAGDSQTPRDSAVELTAQVTAQVTEQVGKASRELDRLHALLADAITALITHFEELAELTEAERQLARTALTRPLADDERALLVARLQAIEPQISEHLNGALIALQFQDMSSQLINHIRDRIGGLRTVLESPQSAPPPTREALVQGGITSRPVGGRRGGAVELF